MPDLADILLKQWHGQRGGIFFLARRLDRDVQIVRSPLKSGTITYAFLDGSVIRTYGRGAYHRIEKVRGATKNVKSS